VLLLLYYGETFWPVTCTFLKVLKLLTFDNTAYRAIKLLEHAMKVIECVFEKRIRVKVKIDAVQIGFMPGKVTTDAIFTVRHVQRNMGVKEISSILLL